jgi:Asp-tRNA(Asn)/Glu-tRNA(Gln) amidotransferase A subunit family amidase
MSSRKNRQLAYESAATVADAIRTKQVSSVELTKLMLERIEKLNPRINAIVTVTADLRCAVPPRQSRAGRRNDLGAFARRALHDQGLF